MKERTKKEIRETEKLVLDAHIRKCRLLSMKINTVVFSRTVIKKSYADIFPGYRTIIEIIKFVIKIS